VPAAKRVHQLLNSKVWWGKIRNQVNLFADFFPPDFEELVWLFPPLLSKAWYQVGFCTTPFFAFAGFVLGDFIVYSFVRANEHQVLEP